MNQLNVLLNNIFNEIDGKANRWCLLNDLRYHWMISDEFFEGLTLKEFTQIWVSKINFSKGRDNGGFLYQDNENGGFTMGIIDLTNYGPKTPVDFVPPCIAEDIKVSKGVFYEI